uniref:Uncharacterized protein n=1 Tax=uncultured marine virus TaxID=186617 RepID=A0A0F7L2Z3_9VIRU|nr:hypothetical protein [uncultured marine virus]
MDYEYLGIAKTCRISGVKYDLKPGEVYPFESDPGPAFRKVIKTVKKEKVDNGSDS